MRLTAAMPKTPLEQIQTLIERTSGTRFDHLQINTSNLKTRKLVRYAWKPKADSKLSYNGSPVKKLQVFISKTTSAFDRNEHDCCLEISTANTKIIHSLLPQDADDLSDLLIAEGAITDVVAARSLDGALEKSYWSNNYKEDNPKEAGCRYKLLRPVMTQKLIEFLKQEKITEVVLLEYGCGHGNLIAQCVKACQEAKIDVKLAIGTDINQPSLATAIKKHLTDSKIERLQFLEINSFNLASSLDQLIKANAKPTTKVIALSSGATNRFVLNNVSEAMTILQNLFALSIDTVFLSGQTEILCNNTVAKRSGYKLLSQADITLSKTDKEPLLILTKQTKEEVEKYKTKFAEDKDAKNLSDVQLCTTPRLLKRLVVQDMYTRKLPTTIKDEKDFQEMLNQLELGLSDLFLQNATEWTFLLKHAEKYPGFDGESVPLEVSRSKIDAYISSLEESVNNDVYPLAVSLIKVYRYGIRYRELTTEGLVHTRCGEDFNKLIDLYYLLLERGILSAEQFNSMMNYHLNCCGAEQANICLDGWTYTGKYQRDVVLLYAYKLLYQAEYHKQAFAALFKDKRRNDHEPFAKQVNETPSKQSVTTPSSSSSSSSMAAASKMKS